MIRINLLPYRPEQRLRRLNRILATWAAALACGILLVFGGDLLVQDKIQALSTTHENNRLAIAALDEKLGEIKDINDRKALAQARLDIINRLSNEQTITIHLLDELTRLIPEQVWLTKMETQKDLLTLTGMATSSSVVADFMRQLGTSPYFAHVELSKVAQQEQKNLKVQKDKIKSFSLTLKFAMPKPPKPPPAAPGGKKKADTVRGG